MFPQEVAQAAVAGFVGGVVATVFLKDKLVSFFGRAKAKEEAVVAAAKAKVDAVSVAVKS
jgi:hypothetical protein